MAKTKDTPVTIDRRAAGERRQGQDRRQTDTPVAKDARQGDRRKVQRRRQIDPTTCERDYSGDEIEFMQAMDAYKRSSGRMFPTCSEILEVIRSLGYEKPGASADGSAEPAEGAGQHEPAGDDAEQENEELDAENLG